jgi:hypothetical protein
MDEAVSLSDPYDYLPFFSRKVTEVLIFFHIGHASTYQSMEFITVSWPKIINIGSRLLFSQFDLKMQKAGYSKMFAN